MANDIENIYIFLIFILLILSPLLHLSPATPFPSIFFSFFPRSPSPPPPVQIPQHYQIGKFSGHLTGETIGTEVKNSELSKFLDGVGRNQIDETTAEQMEE